MKEFNEGYEIIAAETFCIRSWDDGEERIVLGKMDTRFGTHYVTWESLRHPEDEGADFFWGHYFDDERQARADYHRRLADHYCPSDEG